MINKDIKDYCKNCSVEPPAMRFKCPECEHNPDKEQIIIDNVSNFCLVCYYDNKNKELVRIEQYKDGSGDIQTDIESHKYGYNAKIIKPEELIKQLACKTAECEELEEENQQLRNSLSDSLMFKFTGQENETNRYRKALEKIEGLVKNFCKDCDDYEDCNWDKEGCYYSLIPNLKDIIDKVREDIQ